MLDAAQLEAAMRNDDAPAVRELLKHATEPDRRACAKALKALLKGPDPADSAERWQRAFLLAAVGLAGGVAASAEAVWEFSRFFPANESAEDLDLLAAVLTDRQPDWLAETLADEDVAADALLLGAALDWDSRIDVKRLEAELGFASDRLASALSYLAASGRVGYDLADESFFHRELPFGKALESMHPRLANARTLIESGAVTLTDGGALVRSGDSEHRVTFGPDGDRCTCPWWGKHRGNRGPCKHVLAAALVRRAQ